MGRPRSERTPLAKMGRVHLIIFAGQGKVLTQIEEKRTRSTKIVPSISFNLVRANCC